MKFVDLKPGDAFVRIDTNQPDNARYVKLDSEYGIGIDTETWKSLFIDFDDEVNLIKIKVELE
jgi:hypothetical protein